MIYNTKIKFNESSPFRGVGGGINQPPTKKYD